MTDIELEEGEAYFFQDDDENIDPDRDFSYIDKKIEYFLGQYQKDFMGGLSSESLGARFGGYGSFLPMQQRSPPILSDQRNQCHVSSKSAQDLPSERFHQKPASANNTVPARSVPASGDQNVEALSESGISSLKNQSKIQSSGELASNHQKKQVMMLPEKSALKFRVKMASENISRLDKSAIYTGLGLDMSPTSSPEASPSENNDTSIGLQNPNFESPSFILKTMTTMPLSSNDLLSPLHDSLVYLRGMENDLLTGLPGIGEACTDNTVPASMCTKVKKEGKKEKKSRVRDAIKVKKSKHREASEERLSNQKPQALKYVELAKENHENPANVVALSATRRKEDGLLATKEVSNASINAVAYSEEKEHASLMSRNMGSNPCTVSDKRNEAGCSNEDTENPMKQVQLTRHKSKVEPGLAKKNDVVENDMHATTLRGKFKDTSFDSIPRSESSIEKRDEFGLIESEVNMTSKRRSILKDKVKEEILESAHHKDINTTLAPKRESITEKRNEGVRGNEPNKYLKQQRLAKDKVKEEVLDSPCPNVDAVYKENGIVEKNPKDDEVCFISQKNVENDNYNNVLQDVKFDSAEALVPFKKKLHSRKMTLPLTEQSLHNKEKSSSVVKKKFEGSHIGGGLAVEPQKGTLINSSSAPQNEGVIFQNNIASESRKGDTDLHRKTRKNVEVAGKGNSRKKGKAVSSKDFVIGGVSEPEAPASTMQQEDKFNSNKLGLTSNIGSNMEGDLAGPNCLTEKDGDVPPVENDSVVTYEEWVECVKCHKWRLLPLGMSSESLKGKNWTCRSITWLPGMNKCNFSEDKTTIALRALYVPLDPALVQNNQSAYLDANASTNVSADALNVVPPNHDTGFDPLPGRGKRQRDNLVKTKIGSRQSGFQDLHLPVKKDQQHFSEMKNTKNLNKPTRELSSGQKSGDGKSSKIERKRVADAEAHVVAKKLKTGHQQPEADYTPEPLRVSQDLARVTSKYPLVKAKEKTQSFMTSMDEEIYDVSGKKRKLKDKLHHAALPSGKGRHLVKNCDVQNIETEQRKAKKSKSSNFRESSADKRRQRTQSNDLMSNLGDARDSNLHRGDRSDDMHLDHGGRVSRKTPGFRTSEMALDLGLSDNAATSCSSKISLKVKAKAQGLKSSSRASISSSPIKALKSDPDKRTHKKIASHSEHRPNSGAESAENEFAPHNEDFRDRKSNLSRNPVVSDTADEDHFGKKVPFGRHSGAQAIDTQSKFDDYNGTGGKLDPTYEGALTSQQNLVTEIQVTKSPIKLPFDETNSDKGKSHFSKIGNDNDKVVSSNSHGAPEFEGGSGGSISGRVDNVNGMPSRQLAAGQVSLRQWNNAGHANNDIEASSSRKNNIHGDAKTALREAKDLKHSANRLKVAGSGLESTGIFFQAALKFLHGASLLEPNNNEIRSGEISPNEVYSSTARLCEYCALEYERCNDMASAALAYKCMEVAYMRVVYCNDLAASQDRQELQMAVRAVPQVDSPSSSASDIDNLNQATIDTVKDGHSVLDHRSQIVSAGNRPNFMRLLDFTHDINLAMEASRKSQGAFAAAMPVFTEAGNEEGISSVKNVLDFSFHDVDGLLHLVRLAMESIKS